MVMEDVVVGRGAWRSGDLEAFVAFGAPGLPRAIDAHLFAASADGGDEVVDTWSQPVPLDRAYECPAKGRVLLGPPGMAGVLLHLRETGFRRATEVAGAARVRVRSLLDAPTADVRGGHEIVVRLGSFGGIPDALGAVRVVSAEPRPWVTRVEAYLCGPDADPHALAVQLVGPSDALSTIAPSTAVRRATDDLCVRYWTTSDR
jgi:hypothetical protein